MIPRIQSIKRFIDRIFVCIKERIEVQKNGGKNEEEK